MECSAHGRVKWFFLLSEKEDKPSVLDVLLSMYYTDRLSVLDDFTTFQYVIICFSSTILTQTQKELSNLGKKGFLYEKVFFVLIDSANKFIRQF